MSRRWSLCALGTTLLGRLQVSAGYDAHWRDPLAGMQLRTASYHGLAKRIRSMAERLCQGRVVFLLEVCGCGPAVQPCYPCIALEFTDYSELTNYSRIILHRNLI